MPRRQPVPCLWLFTDERMGAALWPALERLPRGGGIVFRHYATPQEQRRALFERVRLVARRRGLLLLRAGDQPMRGEAGVHGPGISRAGAIRSLAAHSRAEAVLGRRAGATILFVSPVFDTRSHPGGPVLGPRRTAMIACDMGVTTIALGGIDAAKFKRLKGLGFSGWAAIDAWRRSSPHQKRKAVPI